MDRPFLASHRYQEEEIGIKKAGGCWVATLGMCVHSLLCTVWGFFDLFMDWFLLKVQSLTCLFTLFL